jgi:hypothetical protein
LELSWKEQFLRELRQAELVPLVGHLKPSGDLFREAFWGQIGPRGAKMGPRGPPRASNYCKAAFTKTFKNHWFFKVFGGPRPSKTASEDPRSLPRGYLGPFGDILSHLGAILATRVF